MNPERLVESFASVTTEFLMGGINVFSWKTLCYRARAWYDRVPVGVVEQRTMILNPGARFGLK